MCIPCIFNFVFLWVWQKHDISLFLRRRSNQSIHFSTTSAPLMLISHLWKVQNWHCQLMSRLVILMIIISKITFPTFFNSYTCHRSIFLILLLFDCNNVLVSKILEMGIYCQISSIFSVILLNHLKISPKRYLKLEPLISINLRQI